MTRVVEFSRIHSAAVRVLPALLARWLPGYKMQRVYCITPGFMAAVEGE